jgi:hypothetical protein
MMPNYLVEATHEIAYQKMMFWRLVPSEIKLEFAFIMTAAKFERRRREIRERHPEYTDDQVRLAEIRDRLGEELFGKAYPNARFPEND